MSDIRVVRGEPTPEELAVVIALASARGGESDETPEPPQRGRWGDPVWGVRRELPAAGRGAWHAAVR